MGIEYKIKFSVPQGYDSSALLNHLPSPIHRATMTEIYNFGYGGRQPGMFLGVHSIAVDSKGNIYTTETYTGKRLQKFIYKGRGAIPKSSKVPAWPGSGN